MENYTEINAKTIDSWADEGWEWSIPVSREQFAQAREGRWSIVLTPLKPVPQNWFPDLHGCRVLGLASGGGQQMPILTAAGACCTVLDYSERQLESERMVALREGYDIELVRADMTKPLPFPDQSFDLIVNPVATCYIEKVEPLWRECFRILRPGGSLLAGFDLPINYAVGQDYLTLQNRLPYNPLADRERLERDIKNNDGIQFSHTVEEQLGGMLHAGFVLADLYEDTWSEGPLFDLNIPAFIAVRAVKPVR